MELSKLLLTAYQFSSVRKPIECVVVFTQCPNSSFAAAGLWSLSKYWGGRDSETKGNALA